MLALWLEDRNLTLREDLDAPEAVPDEARVRVRCAGICNTDLELLRGYYPFTGVPGHEFVGIVERGPALQMLADGTIDPRPLIHGRYPLKHGVEAFERAGEPDALKILVDMT